MDIPSIKFKYFEELKLYHDYLSPNSIFETQKISYWQHEKIILLWAYSNMHQHLYTALWNTRIFQIYGINDSTTQPSDQKVTELEALNITEFDIVGIVDDLKRNKRKIHYIKGNLLIKEFAESISEDNPEIVPAGVRINRKGLLIGEMLHEAYCNKPNFLRKKFRKYQIGMGLLYSLIIISSATLFFVLANQIIELIK